MIILILEHKEAALLQYFFEYDCEKFLRHRPSKKTMEARNRFEKIREITRKFEIWNVEGEFKIELDLITFDFLESYLNDKDLREPIHSPKKDLIDSLINRCRSKLIVFEINRSNPVEKMDLIARLSSSITPGDWKELDTH